MEAKDSVTLDEKCVAAMKPDALSPAETEAKTEGIGVTKAGMATGKCFVSAMLAGAFIAFGGMYFCVFSRRPNNTVRGAAHGRRHLLLPRPRACAVLRR